MLKSHLIHDQIIKIVEHGTKAVREGGPGVRNRVMNDVLSHADSQFF